MSTTNAELIVARASTTRFEEVKRYTVADSAVWAHPAIVGRLIVVKDVEKLICWEVTSRSEPVSGRRPTAGGTSLTAGNVEA